MLEDFVAKFRIKFTKKCQLLVKRYARVLNTDVLLVKYLVVYAGLEKSTRPLVFTSERSIRASGNLP